MSFTDDEVERYARQLVLREVGGQGQQRLKAASVLIVGAGPTGVELAASLALLAKVTLRGNFRLIDPAKARIILLLPKTAG